MLRINFKIVLGILIISILIGIATNVYATDDIIVVLDPGHGGGDSGAVAGGILEKNVNWKIATKVKQILDNTEGITGILSRGENENPSLYDRALVAKNNGADLVVSFHINSSTNSIASGAETYITANVNSPRFYEASKLLGENVLANLRNIGIPSRVYRPIIKFSEDKGPYSDGFAADYYGIIRNPMYFGIPGVLIEHCYISNPYDRANYLNDAKINQIAEADAKAIIEKKENFRINKEENSINSEITLLEVNEKQTHLCGEIIVVEWINGMQAVPTKTPIITLKSTDGTSTIYCYVESKSGNTFVFDTWLTNIDSSKEYILEVSTQDKINIPINNTMVSNLGENRVLGEDNIYNYYIENNHIKSETKEYIGDLNSEITKLNTLKINDEIYYLTGEIIAVEWINGKSNIPRQKPVIRIKSTDEEIDKKCYIKRLNGNTYYFDFDLSSIDMTKTYKLEIASENPNNLSTNKKQDINLSKLSNNIGRCQENKIIQVVQNNLIFNEYTYEGNINSDLKQIKLEQSGSTNYISGEVIIVEWVEGKSIVPEIKPQIKLKSTDGTVEKEAFVEANNTNTYYFDRFIDGIDISKEYYLEIKSGSKANISINNKANIYYTNTQYNNTYIGKYQDKNVKLLKQNIIFEEDTYVGNINSEIKTFNVGKANNATYVSGEIVVVEWVNGISTVPSQKPKMRFKSTDGIINMDVYVTATGTNTYYFDRYIEGIDTSKEYYFEVESGDSRNISEYKKVNVYYTNTKYNNTILGNYKDKKIRLLKQKIIFEDNSYIGDINSELKNIGVVKSGGNTFLNGEIVVVEWVNGVSTVPEVKPIMKFKSTDGTVDMDVFVTATGTNTYYFDRNIQGIDFNKEYYFVIKSGDERNKSTNNSMQVYFTGDFAGKIIGAYGIEKMIMLENNSVIFKDLDENYPIIMNQDEIETFNLINAQRANYGIAPLQIDSRVQLLARVKAEEMVELGYFSHTSPTYGSPFDMLSKAKISYWMAGENIADAPGNSFAVFLWMNSDGHRANILNSNYTHTGIGVVQDGQYGNKIYAQIFITK